VIERLIIEAGVLGINEQQQQLHSLLPARRTAGCGAPRCCPSPLLREGRAGAHTLDELIHHAMRASLVGFALLDRLEIFLFALAFETALPLLLLRALDIFRTRSLFANELAMRTGETILSYTPPYVPQTQSKSGECVQTARPMVCRSARRTSSKPRRTSAWRAPGRRRAVAPIPMLRRTEAARLVQTASRHPAAPSMCSTAVRPLRAC